MTVSKKNQKSNFTIKITAASVHELKHKMCCNVLIINMSVQKFSAKCCKCEICYYEYKIDDFISVNKAMSGYHIE